MLQTFLCFFVVFRKTTGVKQNEIVTFPFWVVYILITKTFGLFLKHFSLLRRLWHHFRRGTNTWICLKLCLFTLVVWTFSWFRLASVLHHHHTILSVEMFQTSFVEMFHQINLSKVIFFRALTTVRGGDREITITSKRHGLLRRPSSSNKGRNSGDE